MTIFVQSSKLEKVCFIFNDCIPWTLIQERLTLKLLRRHKVISVTSRGNLEKCVAQIGFKLSFRLNYKISLHFTAGPNIDKNMNK